MPTAGSSCYAVVMADATRHELRNELQALRLGLPAYAVLIKQGRDDEARAALSEMQAAVERIEQLATGISVEDDSSTG